MTAKEHPMYNTYLYWKKNKETIKQRIENTFDLKHKLYRRKAIAKAIKK